MDLSPIRRAYRIFTFLNCPPSRNFLRNVFPSSGSDPPRRGRQIPVDLKQRIFWSGIITMFRKSIAKLYSTSVPEGGLSGNRADKLKVGFGKVPASFRSAAESPSCSNVAWRSRLLSEAISTTVLTVSGLSQHCPYPLKRCVARCLVLFPANRFPVRSRTDCCKLWNASSFSRHLPACKTSAETKVRTTNVVNLRLLITGSFSQNLATLFRDAVRL